MSQLKEGYIKYSNEEERQAAIKYAESLGFKEWSSNDDLIAIDDNCIILWHKNVFWQDNHNERAIKMGLDEIKINTKDYTDSETNCKGCMGPCGEREIDAEYKDEAEFYMKPLKLYKHDFEATKDVPSVTIPTVGTFFNIDPDKYTKTESEDGTITLKPKKKVKVWIRVCKNQEGEILLFRNLTHKQKLDSLDLEKRYNFTHLETIEREYEL